MVGRPYPKYEPYRGTSKTNDEDKIDEDDLDKEIERLEKLREKAEKKAQIRGIKKETFELEHPRLVEAQKRGGKAVGRLARFTGLVAREGVARPLKRTTKRRRGIGSIRAVRGRSMPARATADISLTKAIATETWTGDHGFADRDFFGEHEERDLIGDTNKKINIGSNLEQDFFGNNKKKKLI